MIKDIRAFFSRISVYQKRFFTWIFLQAIYLLGLGLTSLVARAVGARFLGVKKGDTAWKQHAKTIDTKTMY